MPIDYDMEQARELYFSAGGLPSQIDRSNDIQWYLRRAAILWRDKAGSRFREGQEYMQETAAQECEERATSWRNSSHSIQAGESDDCADDIRALPIKDDE